MQLRATIKTILPSEQINSSAGKQYTKQLVVVEYGDQYPKQAALVFFGKSQELVNSLSVGETGTFHIEITSREYNGKYYTEASCYKTEFDKSEIPF